MFYIVFLKLRVSCQSKLDQRENFTHYLFRAFGLIKMPRNHELLINPNGIRPPTLNLELLMH